MMGTVPMSLSLGLSDEVESLVKEWIILVMERDRLLRECLNQVMPLPLAMQKTVDYNIMHVTTDARY